MLLIPSMPVTRQRPGPCAHGWVIPPGTTVLPTCLARPGAAGKGTGNWCSPGRGLLVGLSVMEMTAVPTCVSSSSSILVVLQGNSTHPCSHPPPPPPTKAGAVGPGFNPSPLRMGSAGGINEPGAHRGLCAGRMDSMAPQVGLATLGAVPKPQGWSCPTHACSLLPSRKTVESRGPALCPRARPALGRWPCPLTPVRPPAR